MFATSVPRLLSKISPDRRYDIYLYVIKKRMEGEDSEDGFVQN
jgi:hypothetical protein